MKCGSSQARGVVAATALEADEAVLDNVDTPNTVIVSDLVEKLEELQAVSDLLLVFGHNLDRDALLKVDRELVGFVGGIDGVKSPTWSSYVSLEIASHQ
jgi:hypothetical protein